jgi:hypothetical protein
MSKGGRNLLILGAGAIIASLATSAISLYVYHESGDIYLDCSLPDADCPSARSDSEENNRDNVYTFSDNGNVDEHVLTEYLNEIQSPITMIKRLGEPFNDTSMSDESLGI